MTDYVWMDEVATMPPDGRDEFYKRLVRAMTERIWQKGDIFLYKTAFNGYKAGIVESVDGRMLNIKTYSNGYENQYRIEESCCTYVASINDYPELTQ